MRISTLNKNKHDRTKFDCGETALNNYLKQVAGQHDNKDLSRTYVLTSPQNESQIKGFYSLALCQVDLSELPPNIAKKYSNGMYCTLIGRLAVSKSNQRQGLGSLLLMDAIKNAVLSSELVPKPMIIVEAKNEIARDFYKDFGFSEFPKQSNKLYLPQKEAKAMLEQAGVLSI